MEDKLEFRIDISVDKHGRVEATAYKAGDYAEVVRVLAEDVGDVGYVLGQQLDQLVKRARSAEPTAEPKPVDIDKEDIPF